MRRFVGAISALVITVNSICVTTPLFVLGLVRLLVPVHRFRCWWAYPMDKVIDIWVSVFRWLIRRFNLIDIKTEFPADFGDRDAWRVIICNHQSWVDIVILQASFRDVAPVLKFFTKKELIWVPFIGLAMWFLGFPYVYRQSRSSNSLSAARRETNVAVLKRASARFLEKPVAVINFVEGTRFSPEKRDSRASPYRNLLAPRRGGLNQTLVALEDHVDTVLNATIRYTGAVPDFWDLLCGRTDGVELIVEEIPKPSSDRQAMSAWLNDVWLAKDRLLSVRGATGASVS